MEIFGFYADDEKAAFVFVTIIIFTFLIFVWFLPPVWFVVLLVNYYTYCVVATFTLGAIYSAWAFSMLYYEKWNFLRKL